MIPLPSIYLPFNPSSICFDSQSELLFTGSNTGTITSYFCSTTTGLSSKYTSYRAHVGTVADITVDSKGILTIGGGNIKLANRRGIPLWSIE